METTKKPGLMFVVMLLLTMGALLWMCSVVEDFYNFTARTVESASSVAPLSKESILEKSKYIPEKFNTEVKYRTFFLSAPGAQKVELVADFNRWGKDPLVLHGYKKGYFEISVALTSGEYKYAFLVDGQRVLDPINKDRRMYNGEEVCIKTVR